MNYLIMIIISMFMCVTAHMHSMNRYQRNDFLHYVKSFWFGSQAISHIEGMTDRERNIELSYQALLAFKQFEQDRTKPVLDPIMQLVQYGASADCKITIQEKYIEKRFTPLYLALVANSIDYVQTLLENGAQIDDVWSISTIAKTDRTFYYSALQVADRWCDDSGQMKNLIRSYEVQRSKG